MTRTSPITRRAPGPIGVFDSGVGGLTVARAIAERLPDQRLIYLADQAHVPYGGRPLAEVSRFAGALAAHLFGRGAKAVVMACNISSATALETARACFGAERVFGVIRPGARAAVNRSGRLRIGVLATAGTVATGVYTAELQKLAPLCQVIEIACPRFVPLVEAGEVSSRPALEAAREYLEPILERGADTVILGCTHYPFLLPVLEEVAPSIAWVDPAEATAGEMAAADRRVPSAAWPGGDLFLTTGDPQVFRRQLERTWPKRDLVVEHIAWAEIERQALASIAASQVSFE